MHELAVVEGIRLIVETNARAAGARRVLSVRVTVAEFSSYLEDAIAMFWDEVCRDTELEGSRMDVIRVPGEQLCLACCAVFAATRADCRCPTCGSGLVRSVDQVGCSIESIEVEIAGG